MADRADACGASWACCRPAIFATAWPRWPTTKSLTTQFFQYRFTPKQQDLDGHAFGNLFISAMADVSGSFEQALIESSRVLAITGRILPSTLSDVTLSAEVRTDQGLRQIEGESNITHFGGAIERVCLKPDNVRAYPETIRAILDADLIVLGPGSLYTSVLPNLLIKSLPEALRARRAMVMYVCNVATQRGETDGYTVNDHAPRHRAAHRPGHHRRGAGQCAHRRALAQRAGGRGRDGAHRHAGRLAPHIAADVLDEARPWRHDSAKLAQAVMQTYQEIGETNKPWPIISRRDVLKLMGPPARCGRVGSACRLSGEASAEAASSITPLLRYYSADARNKW